MLVFRGVHLGTTISFHTLQGTKTSHLWGKGKSSTQKCRLGDMLVRALLGTKSHGGGRFRWFSGFQCLMIVRWTMLRLQGVQSSKNPPSLILCTFSEVHATVSFWHVGLKCLFKRRAPKKDYPSIIMVQLIMGVSAISRGRSHTISHFPRFGNVQHQVARSFQPCINPCKVDSYGWKWIKTLQSTSFLQCIALGESDELRITYLSI